MGSDSLSVRVRGAATGFSLSVDVTLPLSGHTALFGPSGAGKTMLLRMIAGLDKPADGRIALGSSVWFDADSGIDVAPHRRPVGMVFQDGRLFGHMTVAQNLAYAARRRRDRRGVVDADKVVAALDLGSLMDRMPVRLSGGERQRVALGRALLSKPALILMDEPLSALDRERKARILPYLDRLPRTLGIPSLYVSHDIDEVARLADHTVMVAQGQVQASGATVDLLARPDLQSLTGRFEAGALVEADVIDHDRRMGLTVVAIAGHRLAMPAAERLCPGDRVRLRIRARDVALSLSAVPGVSIRNQIPATVRRIDPEGDAAFAEVTLDIGGQALRARITRAAVEALALNPGQAVYALVKTVSFDRRYV